MKFDVKPNYSYIAELMNNYNIITFNDIGDNNYEVISLFETKWELPNHLTKDDKIKLSNLGEINNEYMKVKITSIGGVEPAISFLNSLIEYNIELNIRKTFYQKLENELKEIIEETDVNHLEYIKIINSVVNQTKLEEKSLDDSSNVSDDSDNSDEDSNLTNNNSEDAIITGNDKLR